MRRAVVILKEDTMSPFELKKHEVQLTDEAKEKLLPECLFIAEILGINPKDIIPSFLRLHGNVLLVELKGRSANGSSLIGCRSFTPREWTYV